MNAETTKGRRIDAIGPQRFGLAAPVFERELPSRIPVEASAVILTKDRPPSGVPAQRSLAMIPSLQARCSSFPSSAPVLRCREPLRLLWRMCCGAAAQKPCKINAVAVLRFGRGGRGHRRESGPDHRSPAEVTCVGVGSRTEADGLHSSGTPALRRPAK
jgi:hypothetical protein